MKTTKKILLLWAPLADYTVACFKQLSLMKDVELYLVFQPGDINAPYSGFDLEFCKKAIPFSPDKKNEIREFCLELNPDVILMSSWNYPLYMSIARKQRKKGTHVVSAFDGQWRGTAKQCLGIITSSFFLKPAIDNFFVPGDRQATFARKLGYKNPLQGYYTANTMRFSAPVHPKEKNNFLFIGRLVSDKGIDRLIEAYKLYRMKVKNPWGLIICGKGPLKNLCEGVAGVTIYDFVQPENLSSIYANARCFILPSIFEPWGVVIHEAALNGLAIIASPACGAAPFFVREGQNGYTVYPEPEMLAGTMQMITEKTEDELSELSATSRTLGSLWSTEKWANYVYQHICHHPESDKKN